jgi:lycopene cyclase domain-containing protein
MKFIKHWKSVFLSIAIVALLFLLWDVYFTAKGYWGFNPAYFMGLLIFKLPI